MKLQYRGSSFCGWQIQPNDETVQGNIESALKTLMKGETPITGCGRTDTGVHAKYYVAHFDTENTIEDKYKWLKSLNALTHQDIGIMDIGEVDDEAHARFDATSRSYEYRIHSGPQPFLRGLSTRIDSLPDFDVLQRASAEFIGRRDYSAFEKTGGDNATSICDVRQSRWEIQGNEFVYHITADRFLRNMVRAIVGTQLDIARGRFSLSDLHGIIEAKDRSGAGTSAAPDGLYLNDVQYSFQF